VQVVYGHAAGEEGLTLRAVLKFDVGWRDPHPGGKDVAQLAPGGDETSAVPLRD
jgi:hypothetical protein